MLKKSVFRTIKSLLGCLIIVSTATAGERLTDTLVTSVDGASGLGGDRVIAQRFFSDNSYDISEVVLMLARTGPAGEPVLELWEEINGAPGNRIGFFQATTTIGGAGAYSFRPEGTIQTESGKNYWVILRGSPSAGTAEQFRWYYGDELDVGEGTGFLVNNWISSDNGDTWQLKFTGWPYMMQVVGQRTDGTRRARMLDLLSGENYPDFNMQVDEVRVPEGILVPGSTISVDVVWNANNCPSCIVRGRLYGNWSYDTPVEDFYYGFNSNNTASINVTLPSEPGTYFLRFLWAFDIGDYPEFSGWNMPSDSQWSTWGGTSVYVLDKPIVVGAASSDGLFGSANGDPYGWKHLENFGWFYSATPDAGWIYHLDHGWIYASGENPTSFWTYSQDMGWAYTDIASGPFFWSANSGWLYHQKNSRRPAMFYSMENNRWLSASQINWIAPLSAPVKLLSVDLSGLADGSLSPASLTVVSPIQEATPSGDTVAITVGDSVGGQMLALEDSAGKPIAISYVTSTELQNGSASLDMESIADAVILTNPVVMLVARESRETLLEQARLHSLYQDLVDQIQYALQVEPENLLDYAVFPGVFDTAMQILIEVMVQAREDSINQLAATADDSNPHIRDGAGNQIVFVNPTMVFYGVSVEPGDVDFLITGRSGVLQAQFAWPPITVSQPVERERPFADGSYNFTFYKGFNVNEPDFFSPFEAQGMASWGNSLKSVCIVIDLLAFCPITDEAIAGIINAIGDPQYMTEGLTEGLISIFTEPENWLKTVEKLVEHISIYWDDYAYMIWQEWPGEKTADYMRTAGKCFKSASAALKRIAKVLQAIDVANSVIPYFVDLAFVAPGKVSYCATQQAGVLSMTCVNEPPVARLSISEGPYYVGKSISANADQTSDDSDLFSSLRFRWDFDGDGLFDTAWGANSFQEFTYTNVGSYTVVCEVKDTDGNISKSAFTVLVETEQAGGGAQHVVLFQDVLPWDSNAFTTMMGHLSIAEGSGPDTYEILTSLELSTRVLQPGTDLVVIANDQTQTFYQRLADNKDRILRFIENGGTILWLACDRGWSGGIMADAGVVLPAGVLYNDRTDEINYLINTNSVLTSSLPGTLSGNYASHEWFSNLPAGVTVFTEDTAGGATLVEYEYGDGFVLLSGQPLEWGYDRLDSYTIGQIYPAVIEYILGLSSAK